MDAAMSLNLARPSTPLPNQVAGHQGVMSDASGSLVIKPALAREIAFYQLIAESSRSSTIAKLKPYIPKFFGTLRLEGRLEGNGTLKQDIPEKAEVPENLSHGFTNPSILDAKLGTVLHEPSASEEKKARMDQQARATTTHNTGLRLTGCQTWHAPTQSYILTPKSFGKSITVQELPTGMVRYFPLPGDTIQSLVLPPSPPSTAASSTTFGNQQLAPPSAASSAPSSATAPPAIPLTPSTGNAEAKEYTQHALTPNLLLRVLGIIDAELEKLETVLRTLEMRFVGASVLVVYEGNPDRLTAALERLDSRPPNTETQLGIPRSTSDASLDSDMIDSEDEDSDDDESDDLDGPKAEEKERRNCPPVVLKLIDFAHTWLADGEGPDEGVLLGIKTLRGLIAGRKEEVRLAL